jgi:hypothetical protein
MMRIPVAHRAILWQSILAYQNQRESVPFDTLVALGFEEQKLLSSAARLPAIFAKLWEPFCFPGAYDFSQWGLQETFEGILGEDRWWFRSAGPAWFLMLMRSAQGLLHAIQELDVKVPVRTIFEDLSLSFAEAPVPQRLREMSPQLIASTKALAQYLCVRVCDGKGEELVNLEMPARCMDELEEIMPLETLNRMQELGIDLGILKRKVQRSAYVPQEIFEAQTQDRHYRVWLR